MMRRGVVLTLIAALSVLLTGCRDLGPNSDHGAKVSEVVYSVTGSGVSTVEYAATGTSVLTRRDGVELPFKVEVHTVDHSETLYKVTATATANQGTLGCTIKVNGVQVYEASAPAGKPVSCSFLK